MLVPILNHAHKYCLGSWEGTSRRRDLQIASAFSKGLAAAQEKLAADQGNQNDHWDHWFWEDMCQKNMCILASSQQTTPKGSCSLAMGCSAGGAAFQAHSISMGQGSQHCPASLWFNLRSAVVALSVGRLRGTVVSIQSKGSSWLWLYYSWSEMIAKQSWTFWLPGLSKTWKPKGEWSKVWGTPTADWG